MYQRINGSDWRSIWLVGDLYGYFALPMNRLRQPRFDSWADLLTFVGDLIDHGPQSVDCLGLLYCRWFKVIRENHEQMALGVLESGDMALRQMNGGSWYGRDTAQQWAEADQLLVRCQRLPLIIEVGRTDTRHVITHTDYPASVYRWQQPVDPQRVLWNRHHLSEYLAGRHGAIVGADHFWLDRMPLRMPYERDNQHYIDTGVAFGGALTLAALQSAG